MRSVKIQLKSIRKTKETIAVEAFMIQSKEKIIWELWCWEIIKEKIIWELWCWEILKGEEKGMTENEMVGWHHWLDGHDFVQAPGVSGGQGAWCAAVCGVTKSHAPLSRWTELQNMRAQFKNYRLFEIIHKVCFFVDVALATVPILR